MADRAMAETPESEPSSVETPSAEARWPRSIPDESWQRDVVVLGGGPAGSTAAALLAEAGRSVAVFEKESYPRFHIGESLMTETWWTLDRLGLVDWLKETSFPRKYSVQFYSAEGKASRPFYFFETNPHESAVTWQVERSVFDEKLLLNAREKGAEVYTSTPARRVFFEGDRAVGVEVETADGPRRISSRVVIDASGLGSVIARQLRLIQPDPKLRKAAVFAHFKNAYRDPGIDEGATLVIDTKRKDGWFWNIPLSHNRASVGVVGSPDALLRGRGTPEEILREEIADNPTMRERLAEAELVPPVRVISDFSYRALRCAGEGWVLTGDAFGFIDPVYSSGLLLALKSGEMAADAVLDGLRTGDLSGAHLGRFGPELVEGMEALRKLVYAFYTPHFSFADFVRQHPEHRDRLVDLLIGNVFKEGVTDIFEDMKAFCDLPEPLPLEV